MQPRPTAAELLAAVAQVLDDEVVPALTGPAQHHARVAASIVAIVERELRLAPETDGAERRALVTLLGRSGDGEIDNLRMDAAAALRDGLADEPGVEREVWVTLMNGVRADLAIVKPGHDAWDGD